MKQFISTNQKIVNFILFFFQFGELPFHLVRSKRFTDLYANVLFNYQWLHAKLSSCPLQSVLSDFEDACANIEDRDVTRYVENLFVSIAQKKRNDKE